MDTPLNVGHCAVCLVFEGKLNVWIQKTDIKDKGIKVIGGWINEKMDEMLNGFADEGTVSEGWIDVRMSRFMNKLIH